MRPLSCRPLVLVVAVMLVVFASLGVATGEARPDEAASVTYDACHVEAYLTPDGNLSVIARWTVSFTGPWRAITWTCDTSHTSAASVAVVGAGEVGAGARIAYGFSTDGSRAPGTYCTAGDFRRRTCTLFLDKADETAELYVAYRLRGAAQRWRDASVLDWRFLEAAEDAGISDVTLDLYIERPDDGGVWPGENVFAWSAVGDETREEKGIEDVVCDTWAVQGVAHGAHAAHVRMDAGPVGEGGHARACVLVPEGWLSDAGRHREPFRSEFFERMAALVSATGKRERDEASVRALGRLAGVVCAVVFVTVGRQCHRRLTRGSVKD